MPSLRDSLSRTGNRLLATLCQEEYNRLLPYLEPVSLVKGRVLYEAGETVRHAYFITSGMVSLLSTTEEGETVQIAMIGNEGMVGLPIILPVHTTPYRLIVQIPGAAIRVKAGVVDAEFKRGGHLQDALLRYIHALLTHISQSAICNRYHTIEQRLCRWLLIARDCARSNTIQLTHESLAHMLGAQRTGISMVAASLQRQGLIRYQRGKIQIFNQQGLEAASC